MPSHFRRRRDLLFDVLLLLILSSRLMILKKEVMSMHVTMVTEHEQVILLFFLIQPFACFLMAHIAIPARLFAIWGAPTVGPVRWGVVRRV